MGGYPSWLQPVARVFSAMGVPYYIWLPIAYQESGLRPDAEGDNGASIGLFQLYTKGGQGDGYEKTQLIDPVMNAAIAVRAIAAAYGKYGDDMVAVARNSGHPNLNLPESDPWLVEMARLSNVLKTQTSDPLEAYDLLVNNVTPTPGSQSDPSDPESKPGDGSGAPPPSGVNPLVGAFSDAIKGLGVSLQNTLHQGVLDWGLPVGAVILGLAFVVVAVAGFTRSAGVSVAIGAANG